jgi:Sulfatase
MADRDLAGHILRVLDAEGPRTFIFAITMGSHGPWLADGRQADPELASLIDSGVPQRAELMRYLAGLRQTDEMLRLLVGGLERRGSEAVLAGYGDHLPSLTAAFAHFGWDASSDRENWRSDYAIWTGVGSAARRRDLAAHELGRFVADIALAPREPLVLDGVVREARRA